MPSGEALRGVRGRDSRARKSRKNREGPSRTRIVLLAALALGFAVRLPFWVMAMKAPLAADTAIVGLMARHPAAGLRFWGQPYGSPLEARPGRRPHAAP